MKNKYSLLGVLLIAALFLGSCTKDSTSGPVAGSGSKYILNYGSYKGAKSTITLFNSEDSSTTNNYFKSVNGFSILSNIQNVYSTHGNIYFMSNNVDEILYVSAADFKQTNNSIVSSDIVKPRSCVAYGNTLYVSCWGGDVWLDASISYIAKIDLSTHKVIGKIALPGGPEGLEVSNGKLYAALGYENKIAVIDLADDSKISYIQTEAVSSYFKKDNSGNLYVALISSYSKPSTETGVGYINTTTDELSLYKLDGVSTAYVNVMELSKDNSKLYVVTSAYNMNYEMVGGVSVFDIASKTFEQDRFVSDITGINGVDVDPQNGNVMVMVSSGGAINGAMKLYNAEGEFIKECETGINPSRLFTAY